MTRQGRKKTTGHGTESGPATQRPGLDRQIEPDGDLWPGIARRIDPAHAAQAAEASSTQIEPSASLPHPSRRLARGVEPVRDLWPAVRRRLERPEPTASEETGPRVSWVAWTGWAVAAAALVLAFQVPELVDEPRPLSAGDIAALPGTLALPIERARSGRLRARTHLLRVLAEDSSISPETQAIVKRNLQTIDEALTEIQRALATDPGNATLYRLLHSTYRQEAEIVAQVTRRGRDAGGSL